MMRPDPRRRWLRHLGGVALLVALRPGHAGAAPKWPEVKARSRSRYPAVPQLTVSALRDWLRDTTRPHRCCWTCARPRNFPMGTLKARCASTRSVMPCGVCASGRPSCQRSCTARWASGLPRSLTRCWPGALGRSKTWKVRSSSGPMKDSPWSPAMAEPARFIRMTGSGACCCGASSGRARLEPMRIRAAVGVGTARPGPAPAAGLPRPGLRLQTALRASKRTSALFRPARWS